MRKFGILSRFLFLSFLFINPQTLFSKHLLPDGIFLVKSDTTSRTPKYRNAICSSFFLFARSHLGYERKFDSIFSVGVNLYYNNFSNNDFYDYKGELFFRCYSKRKTERYFQGKVLIGFHKRSEGIGCTSTPQEKTSYGLGFNWGRKYFIRSSGFFIEPQFGFKYYRSPFYYQQDTPHCESDYERIFRIEQRNWYLFYPGAFFEFNFIFGYVF